MTASILNRTRGGRARRGAAGRQIYGGGYSPLEAYLYFSHAALEFLQRRGDKPDVLHVHDWHTAPLAMLYWEHYHAALQKPKVRARWGRSGTVGPRWDRGAATLGGPPRARDRGVAVASVGLWDHRIRGTMVGPLWVPRTHMHAP